MSKYKLMRSLKLIDICENDKKGIKIKKNNLEKGERALRFLKGFTDH